MVRTYITFSIFDFTNQNPDRDSIGIPDRESSAAPNEAATSPNEGAVGVVDLGASSEI